MIEVRCKGCRKLLGYFEGKGDVKCPKVYCGGRNIFDTEAENHRFILKQNHTPLSERKTSSGVTFR